ncbi:hypothetical protein SAMN05192551_103256 [Tindallia magadiensis]|uniref:Uncharacterized protein n=1 Tax=Tindallia magadiensis TaxID=69895 RepID=A0A1I3DEC7_9FIRM|nr:hypothetical protein [Tindallia magadiensis]SFH84831.1 hypothetical protein SAMN05192551_103256 [Tindallia magadiensis]
MPSLIGFISGVVINLISSYIYDKNFKEKGNLDYNTPPFVIMINPEITMNFGDNHIQNNIQYDRRKINRRKLKIITLTIGFYIFTLFFLYNAIYLPVFFGGGLTSRELNLGQVKILNLFTETVVSNDSMQTAILLISIIAYMPVLLLVDKIHLIIRKIYDKFLPVTFDAWIKLRFFSFVIVALFISGITVFLVTDISFIKSILLPFIIMIFGIFLHNDKE